MLKKVSYYVFLMFCFLICLFIKKGEFNLELLETTAFYFILYLITSALVKCISRAFYSFVKSSNL